MNLEDFISRFVFIANRAQVVDVHNPHAAALNFNDFSLAYSNEIVEEIGPRGRIVQTKLTRLWLDSAERVTMHDYVYRPTNQWYDNYAWEEDHVRYFNTFRMPLHTEPQSEPERIDSARVRVALEHFDFLFEAPEERNYFVGWLAHMVQYPGQRPKVVPLLIAPKHGTGRGWLVELINKLLGDYNCSVTTVDEMVERKWGNSFGNTLFTCVHECKVRTGRFAINDKIRDQLTEPRLALNMKYGEYGINRPVFTRTLLLSNHLDAVVVPKEDRRIWVAATYGEQERKYKEAYYTALYNFLEDPENIRHIYWYLRQYKINADAYMIEAPWTEAKQSVIEADFGDEAFQLRDILHQLQTAGVLAVHAAQVANYALQADFFNVLPPLTSRARLGHMLSEHLVAYRQGIIRYAGATIRPLFMVGKEGAKMAAKADPEIVRDALATTDRIIAGLLRERGQHLKAVPGRTRAAGDSA